MMSIFHHKVRSKPEAPPQVTPSLRPMAPPSPRGRYQIVHDLTDKQSSQWVVVDTDNNNMAVILVANPDENIARADAASAASQLNAGASPNVGMGAVIKTPIFIKVSPATDADAEQGIFGYAEN